ncbi:MAG: hypothetical protein JW863_01520 [Chitinispirillaceae bacterium]|nr:hypothetical protein [Chitinispirillaceae bacterium]
MKYSPIFILVFTAVAGRLTYAGQFGGTVKDSATGSALSGVVVKLLNYDSIDTTDTSGSFTIVTAGVRYPDAMAVKQTSCIIQNGFITIETTRDTDFRIDLFSTSGARLESRRITLKTGRHTIPPAVEAAGVYVYRIYYGNMVQTSRFITINNRHIGTRMNRLSGEKAGGSTPSVAAANEKPDSVQCTMAGYYSKNVPVAWNTDNTIILMSKVSLTKGIRPGTWTGVTEEGNLFSVYIASDGKTVDSLTLSVIISDCAEAPHTQSFSLNGPIAIPENGVVNLGDSVTIAFTDSSISGTFMTSQKVSWYGSPPCNESVLISTGAGYIVQIVPRYTHDYSVMHGPVSFFYPSYLLTVHSDHGTVTVSPEGPQYLSGQLVSLTIEPEESYRLTSWDGPIAREEGQTAWVLMDDFKEITAEFIKIFKLTVTNSVAGIVEVNPARAMYDTGETVRLIATPKENYCCPYWTGDTSRVSGDTAWVTMSGPKEVMVTYTKYNLLRIEAKHGQVLKSPDISRILSTQPETVLLIARPDSGYLFKSWEGPLLKISNDTAWVILDDDKTITANFAVNFMHAIYPDSATWLPSLAFSPDGSTIAWGSRSGSKSHIKLVDKSSGTVINSLTDINDLAEILYFSSDGSKILAAYSAFGVYLHTVSTGTSISVCPFNHEYSAIFSPDNSMVLSGGEGTLTLWSTDAKRIRSFSIDDGIIRSIAFSPDGSVIAVNAGSDSVKTFDVATGEHLRTIGDMPAVFDILFSTDGKSVLLIGNMVEQIDLTDGKILQKVNIPRNGTLNCAAFSPDGSKAAIGYWGSESLDVFETGTGDLLQECIGHTEPPISVIFSPDGKQLLTRANDYRVILWDVK